MSREVNWLKFRLRGAKTAVEAARTNEQVSLFTRQALEAAESGLAAALLQWDTPFLTNGEKSWREIVMEISLQPRLLWDYVTALRGPDVPYKWPVKTVFTGPLRCKSVHQAVQNATDFERLSPESVVEAFRFVYEHRRRLLHYLVHVESAWRTLHRKVSFLLRGLMSFIPPEDLEAHAREYKKLVDEWLDRENAIDTGGQND